MNWKTGIGLVKQTFAEWSKDNVPRLGAAMAYYTVVSIAPLLLVIIAVAALAFGREAAEGAIVLQLTGLVGETAAQAIQAMIQNASKPSTGILATVLGILTLLAGASGVFAELQSALNTIWEAPARPDKGMLGLLKDRFLSLMMVLGTGFLLLVSLVLSATLAALGSYLQGLLPVPEAIMHLLNFALSFGAITLLFAMMYKILPDVPVAWNDVWIGAAVTALLFTLGKLLIGMYIGKANFASTYGAAGSLVVILVWVYYSTQILLLGAEFTNVYAMTHGSHKQTEKGQLAGKASSTTPARPEAAKTASFPSTPAISPTPPRVGQGPTSFPRPEAAKTASLPGTPTPSPSPPRVGQGPTSVPRPEAAKTVSFPTTPSAPWPKPAETGFGPMGQTPSPLTSSSVPIAPRPPHELAIAPAQPWSLPGQTPSPLKSSSVSGAESARIGSDTGNLGARARSIVNMLLGVYVVIVTWRAATEGLQSTPIDHSGTN